MSENFVAGRFAFTFHTRGVIRTNGTVEADFFVNSNHFAHVVRAVVVKRFGEMFGGSFYVAKMYETDPIFPFPDQRRDIFIHCKVVRLAERQSV